MAFTFITLPALMKLVLAGNVQNGASRAFGWWVY